MTAEAKSHWKCPREGCRRRATVTASDVAEVGTPFCVDHDENMELVSEAPVPRTSCTMTVRPNTDDFALGQNATCAACHRSLMGVKTYVAHTWRTPAMPLPACVYFHTACAPQFKRAPRTNPQKGKP